MHRFLIVIAIIFGFASVSGPMLAKAAAVGDLWTISAADSVCAEASGVRHDAPAFKPCAKKVNGQAVPCDNGSAIMPRIAAWAMPRGAAIYASPNDGPPKSDIDMKLLRPPQALSRA